jgi:imidazolonepropionase-like amidohydrolase
MVEKGMSPMAAIVASTLNVAKAYGKADDYGSVEVGKVADLLVLAADPLKEITNLGKVSEVIKGGERMAVSALPTKPVVTRYPRDADSQL